MTQAEDVRKRMIRMSIPLRQKNKIQCFLSTEKTILTASTHDAQASRPKNSGVAQIVAIAVAEETLLRSASQGRAVL